MGLYERTDVSGDTNLCVCGDRANSPWGTLIHTTGGVNSRSYLQGGSCATSHPAGADALIDKDGHQWILTKPTKYAYHAGNSYVYHNGEYRGDEVSEALIGIELERLDDQAPTYQQYDSLAELIVLYAGLWAWRWPFIIYGHYAVARPIGRRSDPVNFDWGSLMGRLYVHSLSANIPGLVDV